MMRQLHYGSYADEHELLRAMDCFRSRGFEVVDVWSPCPVHGIDERIGIARSRLPLVCFAGGIGGLSLGLLFQYWSSAQDWPLNVGGKPLDSLPAFLPVAFELTVLCAGLITVAALLLRSRLYPGKKTRIHERVSDDRFVMAVSPRDPTLPAAEVEVLFARSGAERSWQEAKR